MSAKENLKAWIAEAQSWPSVASQPATEEFDEERARELEWLDFFKQNRDEILDDLAEASTVTRVSQLSREVNAVLAKAEELAEQMTYFPERMWGLIQLSQPRLLQAVDVALKRVEQQPAAEPRSASKGFLSDFGQSQAEHQKELWRIQKETNDYIRGLQEETARKQRESRERNHRLWLESTMPEFRCAHCYKAVPRGYIFCFDCHQIYGRTRF